MPPAAPQLRVIALPVVVAVTAPGAPGTPGWVPPPQEEPFSVQPVMPGKLPGLPLKPKLALAPGASGEAQLGLVNM